MAAVFHVWCRPRVTVKAIENQTCIWLYQTTWMKVGPSLNWKDQSSCGPVAVHTVNPKIGSESHVSGKCGATVARSVKKCCWDVEVPYSMCGASSGQLLMSMVASKRGLSFVETLFTATTTTILGRTASFVNRFTPSIGHSHKLVVVSESPLGSGGRCGDEAQRRRYRNSYANSKSQDSGGTSRPYVQCVCLPKAITTCRLLLRHHVAKTSIWRICF